MSAVPCPSAPVHPAPRSLPRLTAGAAVLLTLLTTLLLGVGSAAPADARSTLGARVVGEAARHRGAPYVYGAAGPRRFDCSGFTMYVYSRFGIHLPHNAAAQYARVRHVPRSSLRRGDLVFIRYGGHISHVGIYAGYGRWWVAPHTGARVKLQRIYTSSYVVGRI